ncbi:MAG TPA: hypothetical protein VJJ21_00840 [Candidatus Nanoarchaeia archaeon]|nr:hypothetical protein [Candidatus Nanoarchaeia archaeon]
MNKSLLARTLQFIFLMVLLAAAAAAMNSTQYSLSSSIDSSSSNMSNSVFKAAVSLDSISSSSNNSVFSTSIGKEFTIPICGNNIIELGELCDSSSLPGETCLSQGYSIGALACSSNCLSYNTSACITLLPQQGSSSGGEVTSSSSSSSSTEETTTTSTTTSTTLALPQKESPSIIDKTKQIIQETKKTLEKIEKGSKIAYIASIIAAIILLFYTIYLLAKLSIIILKKLIIEFKKEKARLSRLFEKQETKSAILKDYIKSNLSKGHSISTITEILLNHNWSKEEIKQSIKEILEESRK